MATTVPTVPDQATLLAGLRSALSGVLAGRHLADARREYNSRASTFASEVVICSLDDGSEVPVFCKYVTDDGHGGHGYPGHRDYEAAVYREVVQPSGCSAPSFYGTYQVPRSSASCLVLEHLAGAVPVSELSLPHLMGAAAEWIARFHAINEARLADTDLRFLRRYDPRFYAGWARRTATYSAPLHARFPWLPALCRRFEIAIALLREAPQTVVHGEYYPKNILARADLFHPIDWESAAVGPGEVDLACLTDGWPPDIAAECELAYLQTRWPHGAPDQFARILDAARLFVHLRWLGDWPPQTLEEGFQWRFDELKWIGERMGLISGVDGA